MAEQFASKTEAATPHRREQAREQGQVAYSGELVTGVIVLAGIAMLSWGASRLGGEMLAETRQGILGGARVEMTVGEAQVLIGYALRRCLELIAPLLAVLSVGALGACVVQVGFYPNSGLLAFKWERIAPFAGGGRFFSAKNAMRGLLAIVRLAVVALLAWWVLGRQLPQIALLGNTQLAPAVAHAWAIVIRLALALGGGMLLLGVGDYLFNAGVTNTHYV